MRLLVTGGRFWNQREEAYKWLDMIHEEMGVTVLIHGDAKGADRLCRDWALENNIETEAYPITKEDWRIIGNKAGPIRNQQMIDEGKPDMLMAFLGGTGTAHMKRIAKKAKLDTIVWQPEEPNT
jgi:hypothetical protein